MPASTLSTALKIALLASASPLALAQAPQTFTPKQIVQFAQGGDKERAGLSRMPGMAELVKGQFGVGAADLNGDGSAEIIVLSLACDNAGCPVVALQNNGPGKGVTPVFAQKVGGRLAITNEKVNGYFAFAAADPQGAIMKNSRGQQVVYPIGAPAAATPPSAAPKPAPTPAPAPATSAGQASAAQPAAAAASTPVPQASGQFLPVCLAERCLNPRISSKSGIGTANAVAEASVTKEDATAWCAKFNPGYKYCVEDQVAQGGTAGGAKVRANAFKATANCETGKMTAVEGRSYTYDGEWPDGGPGAGRAKFTPPKAWAQKPETPATDVFQLALEPGAGESLAIQWEILCNGAAPPGR